MAHRRKQDRSRSSYWDDITLGFLCVAYRRSDQRGVGVVYRWFKKTYKHRLGACRRPRYRTAVYPKCKDVCYRAIPNFGSGEHHD